MEKLNISRKAEILRTLGRAFTTHPMLPPATPAKTTEAMLELVLDTFGTTEKAYLHGIREDGKLACASFSLDVQVEPRGLAMGRFFFRLFRILGWRLTADFTRAFSKRPKYKDAYPELMLLGTLPAYKGGVDLGERCCGSCMPMPKKPATGASSWAWPRKHLPTVSTAERASSPTTKCIAARCRYTTNLEHR